jgi:phenylalanine-4-hydroxylase
VTELTGELRAVHREGRDTGPNLTATVLELSGPTMVSRAFRCVEKPRRIDAVVLIGGERLPERGPFSLRLQSGVEASGFVVQGHEVVDLHVWEHGRQLPVPTWSLVAVAEAIPSVAGGPADPAMWDEYFGALDAFSGGSGEEAARQHKAEELPSALAALYAEVRRMREGRRPDRKRLESILEAARPFGEEPLLREEVEELLAAA